MESENPDDHQRDEEEQKKRKRAESNKKYYQKIKKGKTQGKTRESKGAPQLKTVQNECRGHKELLEYNEKSVMKPLLDDACKITKHFLELGESSGHARDAVEKQTHLVNSLSRELLKTPPPGGGTCGGTSASTDKDACPPQELSVAAMKLDGSVTTESFKPCQLLPEEWTQPAFNKLSELFIASKTQHAQERVKLLTLHTQEMTAAAAQHKQEMAAAAARHAQEMTVAAAQHKQEMEQEMAAAAAQHKQEMAAAATSHAQEMVAAAAQHKQEMAAAAARHAQEMVAVKMEYNPENLENMGQPLGEAFSDFDIDQFLNLDEKLGCSSAEMKNDVWAP